MGVVRRPKAHARAPHMNDLELNSFDDGARDLLASEAARGQITWEDHAADERPPEPRARRCAVRVSRLTHDPYLAAIAALWAVFFFEQAHVWMSASWYVAAEQALGGHPPHNYGPWDEPLDGHADRLARIVSRASRIMGSSGVCTWFVGAALVHAQARVAATQWSTTCDGLRTIALALSCGLAAVLGAVANGLVEPRLWLAAECMRALAMCAGTWWTAQLEYGVLRPGRNVYGKDPAPYSPRGCVPTPLHYMCVALLACVLALVGGLAWRTPIAWHSRVGVAAILSPAVLTLGWTLLLWRIRRNIRRIQCP